MDYFRPRGDITTVLDLTDRDAQDNYFFPLDTENSWFKRGNNSTEEGGLDHPTVYPSALSVQEFVHTGPADWGQFFTFNIGALPAGDLLQAVVLQIRLGHWYNTKVQQSLSTADYTADLTNNADKYWTYANSLGNAIIEYAEFVVGDQTIEKIPGEFIKTFTSLYANINENFGISYDALGATPYPLLNTATVNNTPVNPNRPFITENGVYFCVLPFFFLRTKLKESFPLLACNEGNVRVNIKLRPFSDSVRKYIGFRNSCDETPLGLQTPFQTPNGIAQTLNAQTTPIFQDFRVLTFASLINGSVRNAFLHKPFEQMIRLSQTFTFDEPLKYIVSKPNPNNDTIEIQLPLELNHPVQEILWVFRRKAVQINNEWVNFTPAISYQYVPNRIFPEWLDQATIRINGSEVISAPGNWFREHIASKHQGGYTAWSSHIYGYSFAEYPDEHQPSGAANMSRTNSITLNMKVNIPIKPVIPNNKWDDTVLGGWEVFVFAIHYNWLRFENGICNKMFSD